MYVVKAIRLAYRAPSEDGCIRKELEQGETQTLFALKEVEGIDQIDWPEQWWLESSLKRRFNVGVLGISFCLFAIFALFPKIILTVYTYLTVHDQAFPYVDYHLLGLVVDVCMIAVPLAAVRAVFWKLKRNVRDINRYVKHHLVTAPTPAGLFTQDQVEKINETYLARFFKPKTMAYLQALSDIAFSRRYQVVAFVFSLTLSGILLWGLNWPYFGPENTSVRLLDFFVLRVCLWPLVWGIIGMFSWSLAIGYVMFLVLIWIVNLVDVPRHRPLRIHYGHLSDLFVSVFSYVGLLTGFGSVNYLTVGALIPSPQLPPTHSITGTYMTIISIAILTTIVLSGLYAMHAAMEDSKSRKLEELEVKMRKEKDPVGYQMILEDYRTTAETATWPLTSSTFLQMVIAGVFSVMGTMIARALRLGTP
jgi:hypothetical protein